MSQANDLLNSLTEGGAGTSEDEVVVTPSGEAGTTPEERHIVIGRDRFVIVPEELKKVAVQYDHNIETVTFDCPRYWDDKDMSTMKIYVNYIRSDGFVGTCLCENVVVDENDSELMHFDWTISGNVTFAHGGLIFLVCAKTTDSDGNEETHWNSERCTDMYVSEGLKCVDIILRRYPDIITQLLERMDTAEETVTLAEESATASAESANIAMIRASESVNAAKASEESAAASAESAKNAELSVADIKSKVDAVDEAKDAAIAASETAVNAAETAENAALTMTDFIVVGSDQPSHKCLWFNTGSSGASASNVAPLSLTDDLENTSVFAEIDDTTYGVENATIGREATESNYNFNII